MNRTAISALALLAGGLAGCKDDPPPPSTPDAGVESDGGPVFAPIVLPALGTPEPNFFDVWGTSANEIFVVGEAGAVLRGDGSTWIPEVTTTTAALRGVWGLPRPDPMGGPDLVEVFAVGNKGTILRRAPGGGWAAEASPTTLDLRAVRGRRDRVFAVGVDGTMITRDLDDPAAPWTRVMVPTQETMHGLWIDGANGVAVGNLGLVLRLQGDGTWVRQRIDGLSIPLQGVWGTGPDALWIVGLDGTILRSRGMEFGEVRGAPTFYLRRVVGLGGNEVWITAWGGNLVHVEGDTVTPYSGFSDHRLEGIWATTVEVPDPADTADAGLTIRVPRYYVAGVTGQLLVGP